MSTTLITQEEPLIIQENPGPQLARMREKKGYSQEFVASKLHLRVKVIELLEADNYQELPEPVFIKGYLRAYAKLIGLPIEPIIATFNSIYCFDRKLEKALWQSKRESHQGEVVLRWVTALISISVLVAVALWWQKNKENQSLLTATSSTMEILPKTVAHEITKTVDHEIKLTDLAKMQAILSAKMPSNITASTELKSKAPYQEALSGD